MDKLFIGCPVQHARKYISGKWQIGILSRLKNGPIRFVELKKSLPGISDKMLTSELRFFEDAGIIDKQIFASVPPKVEYTLTEKGLTLIPIITPIIKWGYFSLQDEKANRKMLLTHSEVIYELEGNMDDPSPD